MTVELAGWAENVVWYSSGADMPRHKIGNQTLHHRA